MPETKMEKAVILDLYTHGLNHHYNPQAVQHMKDSLSIGHNNDDVIYLYILTSVDNAEGVNREWKMAAETCGKIVKKVVSDSERLSSFYKAKLMLDDQAISAVRLLCRSEDKAFWVNVCRLLLSPVHKWDVEALGSKIVLNGDQNRKTDKISDSSENGSVVLPASCDVAIKYDSSQSEKTYSNFEEEVTEEVKQFLKTLPSFLGAPEVEKSELLPGKEEGFVHGYSTRRGGVSAIPTMCGMNLHYTELKRDALLVINENRRRLGLVGGFDHEKFHIVRVEHGHKVWVVGDDPPDRYDALVTDRCDVTIAAAGADCIPLLFADPVRKVVGAAHAGWKGTVERVGEVVVQTMKDRFGCRPEDIRVAMGPGVRPGCFTVLEEEGQMFHAVHPSCLLGSNFQPVNHRVDTTHVESGDCSSVSSKYANGYHRATRSCVDPSDSSGATDNDLPAFDLVEYGAEATQRSSVEPTRDDATRLDTDELSEPRITKEKLLRGPCLIKLHHGEFKVKPLTPEQLQPKSPRPPKDCRLPRLHVDLQMANYHVLLQTGVQSDHIDMSTSHCTRCNPELYYSHERDGVPFGNQIGFICMPSQD